MKVVSFKAILVIATLLSASWWLSSCSEEVDETATIRVTSVTVVGQGLVVGETLQLKADVNPEDATNKRVAWSISDESIATISDEGVLEALAPGKVIATASAQDGSQTVGTKEIMVADKSSTLPDESTTSPGESPTSPSETPETAVPVSSITVEAKDITGGSITQASVKILPENASNQNVSWKVSDQFVASIDEDGKITARKNGTVTITATAQDGSKVVGSKQITVSDWKRNGFTFGTGSYATSQVYLQEIIIGSGGYVLYFYPSSYERNGFNYFTGIGNHIEVELTALEDKENIMEVPPGEYQEFERNFTGVSLGHDISPFTLRTDESWSVVVEEANFVNIEKDGDQYKITYSIAFRNDDAPSDSPVQFAKGYYEGSVIFLD